MGCTLSFCHFTNSESEAPRSWVARRGLPHSCGWPMSTRARLGRSCPETAPAAPDPPPAPSWSPLPLPLHFALRRGPLLFSSTPACALGLTRVPLRGRLRFPTFLAHLQPPVPAVSTAHTQISPLRGEHKQHSRNRPAAASSLPSPARLRSLLTAVRARATMPWPPASPPTHSSGHGDPCPPLPLESCSCQRSQ